ncbi:MAG: hypothetical protein K5770_04480 [Lachnospiraceae bacterium]|nr:hypothetical protein [Lachnospiraceae bacterium]
MDKSGQVASGENNNKKNGREYFTLRELFDILYGKRKAKDSVPLFSEAGTMIEDIINEEIDNYFLKNTADPEELKRSESIGSNFNRYRAASEKLKQYQVKKHGEEQLGQFFFPQLTERYGDPYADLQRYKSGDPKEDINEGVRKRHYEGNETLGRHVARLLNPYTKISKAASLKALSEDRTYIGRELLKNDSLWNMKNHFMAVYFILKKSGYDKNEFNDKLLSFLDKTGYIGKIDLEKADGSYPGKDIKRVLERIRTLLNAGKDAFAFYDLLLLACFQDELTTELADNLLGFTEESPGTDNRTEFNKEGSPGWADEGIRPLSANPFCNTFIERPGLLNALEEGFIQHKLILLSGVTGEGKSETARAFVQSEERKRKEGKSARFHHFIWLSCPEESSPSGLDQLMKVNGRSLKNKPAALRKDVLYIADGLNTLGRGILSDLLEKTGEAGVLLTSLKSFPHALVKTSPEKFLEIPVGENGIRKREFARQVFLAYLEVKAP